MINKTNNNKTNNNKSNNSKSDNNESNNNKSNNSKSNNSKSNNGKSNNNKTNNGFVLWFTGLPCSGKTTIADRIAVLLKEKDILIERLDGDIVRNSICSDLGFSQIDRIENIKRITFISKLLSRNGIGVVATFVSPYRKIRQYIRIQTTNYIEVFVDCPLKECIKRDVKGMYHLAEKGLIKNFTGISSPYEKPETPEITLFTAKETIDDCCNKILKYLEKKYNKNFLSIFAL